MLSLSTKNHIDRLHWLMSCFQGYVGAISYMGGKFTALEPSLEPIMRKTAKRGVIFVDGSSSTRSFAG